MGDAGRGRLARTIAAKRMISLTPRKPRRRKGKRIDNDVRTRSSAFARGDGAAFVTHATRNGLLRRSRPIVVSGPWPGYTRVSSGSVSSRSRMERMSVGPSLVGKS